MIKEETLLSLQNNKENITSVAKALRILDTYTHKKPIQKVTDISEILNLPTSTTSRLMQILADEGFLAKDISSTGYMLGPKVLKLGGLFVSTSKIYHEVSPELVRLGAEINENAHIVILKGYEIVYLNKQMSTFYSAMDSDIGQTHPAYATSSGKVLLSDKDKNFVEQMFKGDLKKFTKNTITDYPTFELELEKVRTNGYIVSVGELEEHNFSVAAPVYDENNMIVAAVSIAAPISRRSDPKKEAQFIKKLIETTESASERLSYAEDGYI